MGIFWRMVAGEDRCRCGICAVMQTLLAPNWTNECCHLVNSEMAGSVKKIYTSPESGETLVPNGSLIRGGTGAAGPGTSFEEKSAYVLITPNHQNHWNDCEVCPKGGISRIHLVHLYSLHDVIFIGTCTHDCAAHQCPDSLSPSLLLRHLHRKYLMIIRSLLARAEAMASLDSEGEGAFKDARGNMDPLRAEGGATTIEWAVRDRSQI